MSRKRFMAFDRQGGPLFDLNLDQMQGEGATRTEKLNGEHKLDISTTQRLEEGLRILSQDGTGKWREWVVDEPADEHDEYDMIGTYGCTWSMQYDLATFDGGELWPGTYTPITAGAALRMVLGVQHVWEVGNVTVSGTAGTTLYDGCVWDYLGKLQEVWGGEMEPRIAVDSNGVTHRYVDWLAHVGSEAPNRRFDYGEDCTRINRKPAPGPRYCRIVPRGGRDATDNDGISYSERVGVEEEPYRSGDGWVHDANSKWVRDPEAETDFRVPDGNGGWHYPEKVVIYDTDDPEELLELAAAEIHEHTRPKVTYEADVLQFAEAGMDPHGVQLGDEVQIVDREFGDAPLRLQARIVEMTVNELDETDVQLVIGSPNEGIEAAFKSMRSAIDAAEERSRRIEGAGTLVYLQQLLEELNAEINADGGYTYFVNGEGTVTYDKAVANPLIGTEADKVTQVKGGSIRIANEKKAQFAGINDWKWKSLIVAGHIAAELVTAAQIVAGYIGSAGDTFIDLDNHTARFGPDDGYHLTVDTNGLRFWYANTLLGQYLSASMQLGLSTGPHVVVNSTGMYVYNGSTLLGFFGYESGNGIVRIGTLDKLEMTKDSLIASESNAAVPYLVMKNAADDETLTLTATRSLTHDTSTHFCYDITRDNDVLLEALSVKVDGTSISKSNYYVSYIRNISMLEVVDVYNPSKPRNRAIARVMVARDVISSGSTVTVTFAAKENSKRYFRFGSGYMSGENVDPSRFGNNSMSSGYDSIAHDESSVALGFNAEARGVGASAIGVGVTNRPYTKNNVSIYPPGQCVVGSAYCERRTDVYLFLVRSSEGYVAAVDSYGNMSISGSLTQHSDKRLKTHIAYLGDDACEFVRKLRPALFEKDDRRLVGFYAQDVQDVEPNDWDTTIVSEDKLNTSLDFDPLTLDYNALIAPLVAYAQHLERRLDEQQRTIESLVSRIEALEATR